MLSTRNQRAAAVLFVSLAAASCSSKNYARSAGPAFETVMSGLDSPAETRVFLSDQYAAEELPGSVMIARGGIVEPIENVSPKTWARMEGEKVKADYVLLVEPPDESIQGYGFVAMRRTPAELGYFQKDAQVTAIKTSVVADAGLLVGDEILAINGVPFADRVPELLRIQPGDTVSFDVRRGNQELELHWLTESNPPTHLDLPEAVVEGP